MLAKRPKFKDFEPEVYARWEKSGCFQPEVNSSGKPFCILLPPPNANADLHVGHAMFVVEDLLARWQRMKGKSVLWLPGTDHAGFETQYVFEKHLSAEGKSRFDFNRKDLYERIFSFVEENSGLIESQLRCLGFSLDWTRESFTLDPRVVHQVQETFNQMVKDGLVYRENYIVNYCPYYGTTFADLEVKYVEKPGSLWYFKYPFQNRDLGEIVVATTRPETMLGDTAVAVHPQDERYQSLIGEKIDLPLVGREIAVIADELVDPEFGTGAVKVTPAHDSNDFEMGQRHQLEIIPVIDFKGKIVPGFGQFSKLTSLEARKAVVFEMEKQGFLEKIDEDYTHRVAVSYKGNHLIEPMVMPNWFVKAEVLAGPAIEAVKRKDIRFFPKRFEKMFYQWMENIRPWPISRQIVWGIRLPVWYSVTDNPDLQISFLNQSGEVVSGKIADLSSDYSLEEIRQGLQSLIAPIESEYVVSSDLPGDNFLPETDVFDTWFSSGQWPLVTLGFPEGEDFQKFYPTDVLDTMWDILFFWVARMIMFGLYLTGQVPFRDVYLHSMVTDEKGAKMSKSKGNVVNPLDVVEEYGADALRMSLLVGSAPGNPVTLSMEKVKGFRNFVTKIWNASRFCLMRAEALKIDLSSLDIDNFDFSFSQPEKQIIDRLITVQKKTDQSLSKYRFSITGEILYDFFWHDFCDVFIEAEKEKLLEDQGVESLQAMRVLMRVLVDSLKLIHPFMPFVTEEIYQNLKQNGLQGKGLKNFLMISDWESVKLS